MACGQGAGEACFGPSAKCVGGLTAATSEPFRVGEQEGTGSDLNVVEGSDHGRWFIRKIVDNIFAEQLSIALA